jgi:hypothetical protein
MALSTAPLADAGDAAAGWPRLGLAEEFHIPPQLGELRHQLAPPGLGRRRLLPSTDRGRRPTGRGHLDGAGGAGAAIAVPDGPV